MMKKAKDTRYGTSFSGEMKGKVSILYGKVEQKFTLFDNGAHYSQNEKSSVLMVTTNL